MTSDIQLVQQAMQSRQDTPASSNDRYQSNIFWAKYELHINQLKLDFIELQNQTLNSQVLEDHYLKGLSKLREYVADNRHFFNVARCSSIFAVPTQTLDPHESHIHRLWLGGNIPANARAAISQWRLAEKEANNWQYQNILWVWDKKQLQQDPNFAASGGQGLFTLGVYQLGHDTLNVNSLERLMEKLDKDNCNIVSHLHDKGYYASLSDYFRILILIEFGGIYMDCDTIPYKTAPLYLAKPEVPRFFDNSGEKSRAPLKNALIL